MQKEKIRLAVWAFCAAAIILTAAFAPYVTPFDPYEQNLAEALAPPNATHILGADAYGRDMLSRTIIGARVSVFSALAVAFGVSVLGAALGIISGWFGGVTDSVIMRVADLFFAFPGLVFAIAIAGVTGGGTLNAVFALTAVSWPKYARLARSATLAVKEQPYMLAAKLSGCGFLRILRAYIIPNIINVIAVTAALDIGAVMMEISGLSFLGLGAKPPTAEWGSMMSNGRSMIQTCPWTILAPGAAIFISVSVFNLLGDAVRDINDKK